MYSKAVATQIRQEFWTAFGKYLSPVLSSDEEHINWINYHTGYKHVYFRMDAGTRTALISIELTHPDHKTRHLFYERFVSLKNIFHDHVHGDWHYEKDTEDEDGKIISRISRKKENVNILDKNCWPEIISFFKPSIIELDAFWNLVKYGFEDLR